MSRRAIEIGIFLDQHGWGDADQMPFAADFSSRRYARLDRGDDKRAILMDADPDQKTDSFIVIAEVLRSLDISSPEIYAADEMQGFVLMEYLGNKNFGNSLDSGADARSIYMRAVDVLVHLHSSFDKKKFGDLDLPTFGGALFAAQVEFFIDYYFPFLHNREVTHDEAEAFRAAWKQALKGVEALPQSLLLRDFMPDNLMDLPDRKGWRSVGVLDFQDAGLGPIAYDLASLCEVVRREGGDEFLPDVISCYHQKAKPALSLEELRSACAILAAQRHMRILGIIARLVQKTGEREKLSYLPRIRNYLDQLLKDEILKPVREWVNQAAEAS